MSILCESCTHYRVCMFPTMTPHLHGYCDELEYPFTLGIFKEALPGAFTAPEKCDSHEEKVQHD